MMKSIALVIILAVAAAGVYFLAIRKTPAPLPQDRAVSLYYYNPALDEDESGNILCSAQGLVAVARSVPEGSTVIEDTIRLLIEGDLTEAERAQGLTTEFPLEGFSLTSARLENGVLTLTFTDAMNRSGGGACRVGILWAQIERTARQFTGVQEVRFEPEELFQP